jgi:hypothetical protein
LGGFATYMTNFFPGSVPADDWGVFPIIGNTGTTVLAGGDDFFEFNTCVTAVENGEEYVKLAQLTDTLDSMFSICDAPWDLSGLADEHPQRRAQRHLRARRRAGGQLLA